MNEKKLVYGLLVVIHIAVLPFFFKYNLSILSYFFAAVLMLKVAYLTFKIFSKNVTTQDRIEIIDFVCIGALVCISLYISYRLLHANSIWLDESDDGLLAYYSDDITSAAQGFQQPPLAYFWRKVSLLIFGLNELGLRIASAFGNALFIAVMYLNLKKITKKSIYSALGILFLSMNYLIINYSVEGRPYAISLFYFSVFIYFMLEFILNDRSKNKIHQNYLDLFFSSFLWLMSIGLQPVVFMGCLVGFLLLLYFMQKNNKWLMLIFVLLISLGAHLPFFLEIVQSSSSYLYRGYFSTSDFFAKIKEHAFVLKSVYFDNWQHSVISSTMMLINLIGLFFLKNKKNLIMISLFCLFFVLAETILFSAAIKWNLNRRYFISSIPLFYMLFLSYVDFAFGEKFKILIVVFSCSLAMYANIISPPQKEFSTNWRELYESVDSNTVAKSQVYIFSLQKPNTMMDELFIAKDYYPTQKAYFKNRIEFNPPIYMTNDYIFENLSVNFGAKEIFFITMNNFDDAIFLNNLELENSEKQDIGIFNIYKANDGISLYDFANSFYKKIESSQLQEYQKLRAYDGLFLLALFDGKCIRADEYFKKFETTANLFGTAYLPRVNLSKVKLANKCKNGQRS